MFISHSFNISIKIQYRHICTILSCLLIITACTSQTGPVVTVKSIDSGLSDAIAPEYKKKIDEIKRSSTQTKDSHLDEVIESTHNMNVADYLKLNPETMNRDKVDYKIGGYDVLSITIYEEADLSRDHVRVAADGYISFPLVGRIKVENMTTSEIEQRISQKLMEGQFLFDAHVSVMVEEYRSKQYLVLGSVKAPGKYYLREQERFLDAISRSKGIDFEQGGKQAMIVRTEYPNSEYERKIVIRIDLDALLNGSDQMSNIPLQDNDVLYFPKPEFFYIIGQVKTPGSYPYVQKK
ncbi:MAG: Polysaccharide export protein [Candidatus Magnetoglobus multicellularis str. Araruama]|uniref:Polysaccharide export protein n=1 Tax=Candidatus Magnetoglobus multicellularis str. Araruama TaxID=890399 RepID=A0A1V1PDH0_9BACT|nr:MAG: Polysaccharide export protein [Candidatus Magnetoglobus multicellularis str. Araruama]